MSVESYEQQILKAVDILTEGAIKDLKFDKTILATVESIQDISIGEHKVRFQDGTFSAFSSSPGLYYTPGSLVYVQVPQGDFSERKIIVSGKTTLPNNELAEHINDFIENKYPEDAKAWIQSWWTPSTEDPADSWTDALSLHEGDFWYQTDTNNYFRYTLGEGGIYQWEMIQGINAVTGFLTNESHTVAAAADGTGYSLVTAGGNFKVYSGTTDVTAECTFSGTTTKSGLTLTISSTGAYTLSGTSWTSDSESFTLTAAYNGVTIIKSYTITKSKAGATGTPASIYELEIDPPSINRGRDGVLTPAFLTINSYKIIGNATRTAYAGRFKIYENGSSTASYTSATDQTSYTYTPSATTNHIKVELWLAGGFSTLLDTQSAVITNDATGGNLLYTNEWEETSTEITSTTFPHWGPVTNLDDGINNNTIISMSGPFDNYVNTWKMTLLNSSTWVNTYSKEFNIDNTKTYRFTMWIKKEGIGEDLNGKVYIGTKANGVCNLNIADNTLNSNPYFYAKSLSILNEWLLFVGYIYPTTLEDISHKVEGGLYNIKGELQDNSITNFKWPTTQNSSLFRFGYGYNTAQDLVYFYAPRVELCDGTELPLEAFFSTSQLLADTNEAFQNIYGTLNDDGVISSVEKRSLFELWKEIINEVTLLKNKANESRFINQIEPDIINDFNTSYTLLYNYIVGSPESTNYPGLFLFNDLTTDTPLCLLVERDSVQQETIDLLPDENIIMASTVYWDFKWENFYTAKENLEEEIRLIELNQYTMQQEELASLTSFQAGAEGTIQAIKDQIIFTTDGLIITEENNPLKILVSHDRGIILYDGDSELMSLNANALTVNSINASGIITLGMHTIRNYTPTGKAPQTTIG